jgi:hypothetical protein
MLNQRERLEKRAADRADAKALAQVRAALAEAKAALAEADKIVTALADKIAAALAGPL